MSTKVTLLHGEGFHLYFDYAEFDKECILKIGKEIIDMPKELRVQLRNLVSLHETFKNMQRLSKEIDKNDGGLFSFNLKTGEKKEFDGNENYGDENYGNEN